MDVAHRDQLSAQADDWAWNLAINRDALREHGFTEDQIVALLAATLIQSAGHAQVDVYAQLLAKLFPAEED
jgi:hypothetical protein